MAECTGPCTPSALAEAIKNHLGDSWRRYSAARIRILLMNETGCSMPRCYKKAVEILAKGPDAVKNDYREAQETLVVKIEKKPLQTYTPGSGRYPDYTIAEAMYVVIYDEDPVNAHVRMYELLEPILLRGEIARPLFIPVSTKTWDLVQEELLKLLRGLDGDVSRELCKYISKSLMFLADGLERLHPARYEVRMPIRKELVQCVGSQTQT